MTEPKQPSCLPPLFAAALVLSLSLFMAFEAIAHVL